MRTENPLFLSAISLLSGLLFVSVTFAQQTGEIRGTITEETGVPLPGVAITARSPNLQGLRSAVSDKSGNFRLPLLPVGVYDLTFELPSFEKLTLTAQDVRLGFVAGIQIILKPSTISEEITVTAPNPIIDKTRTDNSYRLAATEIARIPAQGRTLEEIISYTPGVTGVRTSSYTGSDTGLPSFRGQGEAGNNWIVDGLSLRGVNQNNLAVAVNYDAWEEVEIVSDGFAPELGQAQGGFINVVTKSGGNSFHGEAGALVRDWRLRADREPQLAVVSVPDTSINHVFGNFGGPVLKDKLWFFFSDNFQRTLDDSAEGTIGWLTIPSGRRRIDTNNIFGKLTFSPDQDHTISLSGTLDAFLTQHGGIGLPETYDKTTHSNSYFSLNYRAILSSDVYLTAALGRYWRRSSLNEPLDGDYGPPSYFWEDIAQWTNNSWGSQNLHEKRTSGSLDITGSFDLGGWGNHDIRAGLFAADNYSDNIFRVTGLDADPWPGNGFDNGISLTWSGSREPVSLFEMGPSRYNNSARGFGFFIRDNLSIGRLSLMFGLRSETQTVYNEAGAKIWSWGLGKFLAPRLGLALDILGDGRNVLKFSYGQFTNPISNEILWLFNRTLGQQFKNYIWQGPGNPTESQLKDPANWEFIWGQYGEAAAGNTEIDPGLKPDRTVKYVLEFDRQIGGSWALKLRGIQSRAKDLIEDITSYDPAVEGSVRWIYANFEWKRRDYKAVEVELNGKIADWFTLNTSYTWSQAKGTNPGQDEPLGAGYEMGPFGDRP